MAQKKVGMKRIHVYTGGEEFAMLKDLRPVLAVCLLLFAAALSIAANRENVEQIKLLERDISGLVSAASRITASGPRAQPIPEVKLVARHGKKAAPLLLELMKFEEFSQGASWNLHVEQQVALALCEIYQEIPEPSRTVYGIRSGERKVAIRKFWARKVAGD